MRGKRVRCAREREQVGVTSERASGSATTSIKCSTRSLRAGAALERSSTLSQSYRGEREKSWAVVAHYRHGEARKRTARLASSASGTEQRGLRGRLLGREAEKVVCGPGGRGTRVSEGSKGSMERTRDALLWIIMILAAKAASTTTKSISSRQARTKRRNETHLRDGRCACCPAAGGGRRTRSSTRRRP